MKTLYLHIGFHKTGSSSIQQSLLHLDQHDWKYISLNPKTGNDSGIIQSIFKKNPWNLRHHLRRGLTRAASMQMASNLRQQYRQQINESQASNLLISAESFCSLNHDEIKQAKKFFQGFGRRLVVVAYIRPVDAYLQSAFQQNLKASPNPVANYSDLPSSLKNTLPDYPRRIQDYISIFGRNNVRLFAFDPVSFPAKDSVVDFCLRLGIPAKYNSFVRVNESLSLLAMKILYFFSAVSYDEQLGQLKKTVKRPTLVSHLIADFASQPSFKICPKILQEVISLHRQRYSELNILVESYRDFSLVPPMLPENNSLQESNLVKSFMDLEVFTDAERVSLIATCPNECQLGKSQKSDVDLVKSYLEKCSKTGKN